MSFCWNNCKPTLARPPPYLKSLYIPFTVDKVWIFLFVREPQIKQGVLYQSNSWVKCNKIISICASGKAAEKSAFAYTANGSANGRF